MRMSLSVKALVCRTSRELLKFCLVIVTCESYVREMLELTIGTKEKAREKRTLKAF